MADHFDEPLDAALIFNAGTPSNLFDLIDGTQIDTPPLIGGSGASIEDGVPQLTYPPFFGFGDETVTDTNYQSVQQPQPLLQNTSEVGPFGGSMIAPPLQAPTRINPFNGLEGSPVADSTMMAPVSQDLTIYADSDGVGDETIAGTNYQSVQQPQRLLQNTSEVRPSGGSMIALPLQAPTGIDPFNASEGALVADGTVVTPPHNASSIYANSYDDSRAVDITSGVMAAQPSQVPTGFTNTFGDIRGVVASGTMVNPSHQVQTSYTKNNSFNALEGALVTYGTMVAPPPQVLSNYATLYCNSRTIDMTSGAVMTPPYQVPSNCTNSFGDVRVMTTGTMVTPSHQVQANYTKISSFNALEGALVVDGTTMAPPFQVLSNFTNSYSDSRAIDMTSGAMVASLCQVPTNCTKSFGDIGRVVTANTMTTLPHQFKTSYSRINSFNASDGVLMANGTMVAPPHQILSSIYENSYGSDSKADNMTSSAMVAPPYYAPTNCTNSFGNIGGVVAAGAILETPPLQVQTNYTNLFNSFDGGAMAGGTILAPPCLDPTNYTYPFKASEDASVADGSMVAPPPVAPTRIAPSVTSCDATMVEHSATPTLVGPISATPSTPSMVGPAQPSSAALAEPSPPNSTKPLPITLSRDHSDGGDMMIIPVVEPEEARLGRRQPQRYNSIKASSSQTPSLTTNPNCSRVEAKLPSSGLTVEKRKERPLASSSGHGRGRQGSEWRAEEKKAKRVTSEIIEDGKDIPSSLLEIVRKHQRPIFVESAQGVLGNVYLQCDGNHWVTSLSGPLLILSMEGCFYSRSKASNLRVTLSKDGRIYKGLVKGRLIAASSVTVSYFFR